MGLKEKVIANINSLGVKAAAKFYGVSVGTVSNWASGKTSPSIDAVELTLSDQIGGGLMDLGKEPVVVSSEDAAILLLHTCMKEKLTMVIKLQKDE